MEFLAASDQHENRTTGRKAGTNDGIDLGSKRDLKSSQIKPGGLM